MQRNHFPPHYAENITEHNLPAELIPQYTTLEYELPNRMSSPPAFVFVIDTCISGEELEHLRDSIQQTLNLLPEHALVGLITFGTMVQVHELGFTECPKSYVLRGSKELTAAQVQDMLGLVAGRGAGGGYGQQQGAAGTPGARFLLPVSECSFTVESVLEDIQRDPWPVPADQRVQRCTGTALTVAQALLEAIMPRQGARIMTFVGGPPTVGLGAIVGRPRSEDIRSHTDLAKDNAPHFKKAKAFYTALADKLAVNSHIVDIFACSLDQIGLLEMKVCSVRTGGLMVLADSFGQSVFKESFRRVFSRYPDEGKAGDAGHLSMAFSATLEVMCSREMKVQGAIGSVASLNKASPVVSETVVGEGGTYAWSLGGLDPSSTVAVYFEVANQGTQPIPPNKRRCVQFITQYQHSNGHYRMRVTTCAGPWHSDPADSGPVCLSFDQEAAAVLMARLATQRTAEEETSDILRWLDRSLIRLCAKFAQYRADDPSSFRLPAELSIYPQFMFHLRRSQFLQEFNSSPDESAYYRSLLCRESTNNSLVMIQPSLLSYAFNSPPQPVLLDAESVRADTILLMDTFFHVVVFHGETIGAWREQRYHEQEEHANFRNLLEAPQADAQAIMDFRFPVPRFIVCDQHKSQSRFLMAKLNPSVTHNTMDGSAGEVIFTDDVSLRVFMEHLMKLAVQS